jgi:hypothetical protein
MSQKQPSLDSLIFVKPPKTANGTPEFQCLSCRGGKEIEKFDRRRHKIYTGKDPPAKHQKDMPLSNITYTSKSPVPISSLESGIVSDNSLSTSA